MSTTKYIRAPFNFVPLSERVYIPRWADQISQDVPFEHAVSGAINLRITAKTPMFIRDGHEAADKKSQAGECHFFSKENGRFFIPATSIKGEVRSILEIMSFSKMRVDRSLRYAQRDWNNTELYPIKDPRNLKQNPIRCGWLKRICKDKEAGTYTYQIEPCDSSDKPIYRINHRRIDEYLEEPVLENAFSNKDGRKVDLDSKRDDGFDQKTAAFKYHLLEGKKPLEGLYFAHDNQYKESYQKNRVCIVDENRAEFKGTIVLTGQPNGWDEPYMDHKDRRLKRNPNGGKFYEFVFREPAENAKENPIQISEEEFSRFEFIYRSSRDRSAGNGKSEWDFYMERLTSQKGLPVFFRTDEADPEKIKDFGMAYLYKLPYEKTPYEALPREHKSDKRDLAECIFGYTSDDGGLRGRVHFGSAFSDNAVEADEEVRLALGSPKASYYPLYIRQEGTGGSAQKYATYNDGSLSGWKRYHIRREPLTGEGTCTGNDDIDTIIKPVKAGAVFSSRITFHNLLPVELGALLSALTFHNTGSCFHQLGQGKPYGYGKAVYEVTLDAEDASPASDYMALFEKKMDEFVKKIPSPGTDGQKKGWLESEQMTALITMASVEAGPDFRYMSLDPDKNKNDFLDAKKKDIQEYLQPAATLLTPKHAETLVG